MTRTAAQAAKILGTTTDAVKAWAWEFRDNLSSGANPKKGKPRQFTDTDILALMHVATYWEENPDIEHIRIGLNGEDYFDESNIELLHRNTPIMQEIPSEINEEWTHGVVLDGGAFGGDYGERLELARSYRRSAEALLESALEARDARGFGFPVLYAFRHVLELYLKILGEVEERTHSLVFCLRAVEKLHATKLKNGKLPEPIRGWILEFDKIDPEGTTFRYVDDDAKTLRSAECWLDFRHLKFVMAEVFKPLDAAIRKSGAQGQPSTPKRSSVKN